MPKQTRKRFEGRLRTQTSFVRSILPGDIIEAIPGSSATVLYDNSQPLTSSPTGIIGYVIGTLKNNITLYDQDFSKGKILVRRLYPGIVPTTINSLYTSLEDWAKPEIKDFFHKIGAYFSVSDNNLNKELNKDDFLGKSAIFSEDYIYQQSIYFQEIIPKRNGKDYVFTSFDGKRYSLSHILFHLQKANFKG